MIQGYKECSISSWAATSGLGEKHYVAGQEKEEEKDVRVLLDRAKQLVESNLKTSLDTSMRVEEKERLRWLAPHILELRGENSGIEAHVDHLEASGNVVAGISLLSSVVMEFQHQKYSDLKFKVLIPESSLYFQQLSCFYSYLMVLE